MNVLKAFNNGEYTTNGLKVFDGENWVPAGLNVTQDFGLDTSDATANSSDILSGKTAYVNGEKITGTISSQAAKTITPSNSTQTAIAAGTYASGAVTVSAIPSSYTQLNFTVVGGTTKPSSPSANTIWVNTSTAISSWVFSITQPSSPTAGMVWIQTGVSSIIVFNALKQNNLTVYPTGCKQYVSGAWVSKPMQAYQSGAWKAMEYTVFDIATATNSSAFMYPNNTANTTLNPSIGYTAGQYVYIKNEKNYITTSYLVNDIDLTGFNTLTITGYTSVQGGETACIFPAGTRVIQGGTVEASVVFGTSNADHTINITNLTGKHALGFRFRNVGSRYIYIKKIKLS